jgi:hypothetical protein
VDSITWAGRPNSLSDAAAGLNAERNLLYELGPYRACRGIYCGPQLTYRPKEPPPVTGRTAMTLWVRSWTAAGIAVLALTSIPEMYSVVQPSGVANADVCASVGRRVSVSGCTNVADTVNAYVPPPAEYAPLPQDFPPPPPPPPPVNVCVGAGRRIHVSGCA